MAERLRARRPSAASAVQVSGPAPAFVARRVTAGGSTWSSVAPIRSALSIRSRGSRGRSTWTLKPCSDASLGSRVWVSVRPIGRDNCEVARAMNACSGAPTRGDPDDRPADRPTSETGCRRRSRTPGRDDAADGRRQPPPARQRAQEWLSQLQGMIENLATQAAPVVRRSGPRLPSSPRSRPRRPARSRSAPPCSPRPASGSPSGRPTSPSTFACRGCRRQGERRPRRAEATDDAPSRRDAAADAADDDQRGRRRATTSGVARATRPGRTAARIRILGRPERSPHRSARRPASPDQRPAGRELRPVPARPARRPHPHDARRPRRRPRGAADRRGSPGVRRRGRGPPVRAGQPEIVEPPATTATSRAASRFPAMPPTSRAASASGSWRRTGAAGDQGRGFRPARAGLPARARPPRRQALHRLSRLDGRAHLRRAEDDDGRRRATSPPASTSAPGMTAGPAPRRATEPEPSSSGRGVRRPDPRSALAAAADAPRPRRRRHRARSGRPVAPALAADPGRARPPTRLDVLTPSRPRTRRRSPPSRDRTSASSPTTGRSCRRRSWTAARA